MGININAASIIAGAQAATARDLVVAVNDANLTIGAHNQTSTLMGLARTARAAGRDELAEDLLAMANDNVATIRRRLSGIATRLLREEPAAGSRAAIEADLGRPMTGDEVDYLTAPLERTDADVARDEQAREHDHDAADEAALDREAARDDLLNALDAYARRALGLMGLDDDVLDDALTAAVNALVEATR